MFSEHGAGLALQDKDLERVPSLADYAAQRNAPSNPTSIATRVLAPSASAEGALQCQSDGPAEHVAALKNGPRQERTSKGTA